MKFVSIHVACLLPAVPQTRCDIKAKAAMTCLHGFTIQGNFESQRRNYTRVWDMIHQAQKAKDIPVPYGSRPFHLHLVGRGLVSSMHMPADLKEVVTVHYGLQFPAYYEQVRVAMAVPGRLW